MIARWHQCGTMTSQILARAMASISAVCLTVFPFEFRPQTFTIGFYGKIISELMILECSFPLITERTYKQKFSHIPMRASTQKLHTCSGDSLKAVGKITADILHEGVHHQLPLIVVNVEAHVPSLLGRNWLDKIRLNWSKIVVQRHSVTRGVASVEWRCFAGGGLGGGGGR